MSDWDDGDYCIVGLTEQEMDVTFQALHFFQKVAPFKELSEVQSVELIRKFDKKEFTNWMGTPIFNGNLDDLEDIEDTP